MTNASSVSYILAGSPPPNHNVKHALDGIIGELGQIYNLSDVGWGGTPQYNLY